MKRLVVVSILFLILTGTAISQSLLLEENFDYPEGNLIDVSSNFWKEGSNTSVKIQVVPGSLTYSNYPSSNIGNKIELNGGVESREDVYATFDTQSGDGTSVYASFLLNVTDLTSVITEGDRFLNLNESNSGSARCCVLIRTGSNSSNYQLGIGKTNYSTSNVWYSTDLDINTVYLVVISYTFVSGSGNDIVRLWLNPDLSGTIPAPILESSNGTDGNDIGAVYLDQKAASGQEIIDGLRIATDWSLAPLPVELSSFTASVRNNSVRLNWRTETEVMNYGFEVERALSINNSSDEIHYGKIGFVAGNGNSNKPHNYKFWDKKLEIAGRYFYRLKQIDNDGNFEYSNPVEVLYYDNTGYRLKQNFPNPFNPVTKIEYIIPEQSFVTIKVYDILGKELKTLVNKNLGAGSHSVNFEPGNLPSGFYIYSITAGNFIDVKKMLYLK